MANRQTRVIGGNNTATQSFRLDPGLLQYVQSVFVEVDNTAGPEVNPTLTVATNNGQALAKQRQGRSIPAGDTGSATWALRLGDEAAYAAIPTKTGVYSLVHTNVPPGGTQLAWSFSAGVALLNLASTVFPRVVATGLYALTAHIWYGGPDDAGKFYNARLLADGDVFQAQAYNSAPLITSVALSDSGDTVVAHMAATSQVSLYVLHNSAVNRRFDALVYVVKIGP